MNLSPFGNTSPCGNVCESAPAIGWTTFPNRTRKSSITDTVIVSPSLPKAAPRREHRLSPTGSGPASCATRASRPYRQKFSPARKRQARRAPRASLRRPTEGRIILSAIPMYGQDRTRERLLAIRGLSDSHTGNDQERTAQPRRLGDTGKAEGVALISTSGLK